MSLYNGIDYFGSGPHQIVVGGELIMKKRTGYAGADGVESLIMGGRGYPVIIRGILWAASRMGINNILFDLETEMKLGPATLVDVEGNTYTNVELDRIRLTSTFLTTSNGVIVRYIIMGRKLY